MNEQNIYERCNPVSIRDTVCITNMFPTNNKKLGLKAHLLHSNHWVNINTTRAQINVVNRRIIFS